jgi:hypothetical protein
MGCGEWNSPESHSPESHSPESHSPELATAAASRLTKIFGVRKWACDA